MLANTLQLCDVKEMIRSFVSFRSLSRIEVLIGSQTSELQRSAMQSQRTRRWDVNRAMGMKRLFKLSAEDAAVEYHLLVRGRERESL